MIAGPVGRQAGRQLKRSEALVEDQLTA
jgi:hypothetical protein